MLAEEDIDVWSMINDGIMSDTSSARSIKSKLQTLKQSGLAGSNKFLSSNKKHDSKN